MVLLCRIFTHFLLFHFEDPVMFVVETHNCASSGLLDKTCNCTSLRLKEIQKGHSN
jgi:hypothetical protein